MTTQTLKQNSSLPIEKGYYRIKFLCLLAFTASTFLLEFLLGQKLFNYSLTYIPQLQQDKISPFWEYFSFWGNKTIQIVPFFLLYIFIEQRKVCIILCLNWMVCSMYITTLKHIYHAPRPFWVNGDITPNDCSHSYGNPSGHAITAFSILIFVWFVYRKQIQSFGFKVIFGLIMWGFSILMAFTRVIEGRHAINQVLFGALLGISNAYFFFLAMNAVMNQHLNKLIKKKDIMRSKLVTRYYFILIFLFLVLAAVQVLVVQNYEDLMQDLPKEWLSNILTHCPDFDPKKAYFDQSNKWIGVSLGIGFGAYLGVLVRLQFKSLLYANSLLKQHYKSLVFFRAFFFLLFMSIWFFSITYLNNATNGQSGSDWGKSMRFWFVWFLPTLFVQVLLFGFTERLVLMMTFCCKSTDVINSQKVYQLKEPLVTTQPDNQKTKEAKEV